jgi:pyruvate dehydrogenase complex dehydrogenase (E1) component
VQRPEEPLEGGGGRAEKVVVEGRRLDLDEIRRMRAERGARVDLDDDQLAKVASATMEEKAAEHKRLLAVEEAKGYSHGWAAHRYRETFGVWPRFGEKYDNVQAAERPIVPLPPRKRSAA